MGEEALRRRLEVEDTTAVPFETMCLPEWSKESQEELKSEVALLVQGVLPPPQAALPLARAHAVRELEA
jgi:hypothetical protein